MGILLMFQQIWQELQNLTLLNSLPILFLLTISIFFLKRSRETSKLNLPPSPRKLPIIGNLHQLGRLPHRNLHSLSKKYGPIMLLHLGHAPTLVVSSAEIVKEMTKDHDIAFSNRHRTIAAYIYTYNCADLVFAPYGEYWRQARKASVLQLLSVKRVQSFQYVRDQEIEVSIDKIRRACSSGGSVNLTEILLAISNNIVSTSVLGQKCDDTKFGELSRKVLLQFVSFSFGDVFPSLGWLDVVTGLIPKLKETFKQFDSYLDQVVEEHKVLVNKDKDKIDFVDILLQIQKDKLSEVDLTQENIKAILIDMFVGGSETTSTLTEWTMAELLKHPKVMKKVQEEVRKVVGKKLKIDENDINQMSYLKCVIKESLRLHPPLPFLVPRETSMDVVLGGYDIPSKARVLVNTWAIQRDPEHWDLAEEFIPERFEKENAVDFKGQDYEYIPFGMGRRGCPGMSFGVASAEYMMANILHWFDWELPNGMSLESLDMSENYGLSVQKKDPLLLVPRIHS